MSEIEIISKEIDARDKEANIIHKKIIILLSALVGVGTMFFKVDFLIGEFLSGFTFLFFSLGLLSNYLRLNKLRLDIENLTKEIERVKNG